MIMPWIVFKLSKQFQSVLSMHYVKIHVFIYSLFMYIGFKDETNVLCFTSIILIMYQNFSVENQKLNCSEITNDE